MHALSMNLSVPDLSWNMLDFHTKSTFSFAARANILPCNCRFSAWLVRFSWNVRLVVSLTFVLISVLKVFVRCFALLPVKVGMVLFVHSVQVDGLPEHLLCLGGRLFSDIVGLSTECVVQHIIDNRITLKSSASMADIVCFCVHC